MSKENCHALITLQVVNTVRFKFNAAPNLNLNSTEQIVCFAAIAIKSNPRLSGIRIDGHNDPLLATRTLKHKLQWRNGKLTISTLRQAI